MPDYNDLSREELLALANTLSIDPSYGTLSRAAFELKPPTDGALIFWDIDNMAALNADLGYEGVNGRIRAACAAIRNSLNTLVSRYFSGDEFLYPCPAPDAPGAAARIVELFAQQGISITVGIATIDADGWKPAVVRASDLVQAAKKAGRRGTVN